jgi:hypothetical protein
VDYVLPIVSITLMFFCLEGIIFSAGYDQMNENDYVEVMMALKATAAWTLSVLGTILATIALCLFGFTSLYRVTANANNKGDFQRQQVNNQRSRLARINELADKRETNVWKQLDRADDLSDQQKEVMGTIIDHCQTLADQGFYRVASTCLHDTYLIIDRSLVKPSEDTK